MVLYHQHLLLRKLRFFVLRENRGHTLLELMIVVSIVGLISVLAAPPFITWRESSELKHLISSASAMAKSARLFAITLQQPIYLVVDVTTSNCIAISENDECSCSNLQTCHVAGQQNVLSLSDFSASLDTTSGKNSTITFNPEGTVDFGGSTSLLISNASHRAKIIISALGRVKSCTYQHINGLAQC